MLQGSAFISVSLIIISASDVCHRWAKPLSNGRGGAVLEGFDALILKLSLDF